MKKIFCFLASALVITSQVNCQLYLEGYGGGMLGWSDIAYLKTKNTYGITGLKASFNVPTKKTSSSAIGGFKFGLWFDKSVGFYIDLGFNSLGYHHKIDSKIHYTDTTVTPEDSHVGHADIHLSSNGSAATLAFMLALRANLLKTNKIPTGRVQPYLGIGPSIFFTNQKVKLTVDPHMVDDNNFSLILSDPYTIKTKNKSKSDISLSVDAGIRQMLLKNFSLDYSLKYRFAPISFSYHSDNPLSIKHRYNLFSLQLGLGYHF